jgi:hypothetical protein
MPRRVLFRYVRILSPAHIHTHTHTHTPQCMLADTSFPYIPTLMNRDLCFASGFATLCWLYNHRYECIVSPSLLHTHTHTLSHTHNIHTHSLSYTQHTHALSLSLFNTLIHTFLLSPSLSPSLSHTHTHTQIRVTWKTHITDKGPQFHPLRKMHT